MHIQETYASVQDTMDAITRVQHDDQVIAVTRARGNGHGQFTVTAEVAEAAMLWRCRELLRDEISA